MFMRWLIELSGCHGLGLFIGRVETRTLYSQIGARIHFMFYDAFEASNCFCVVDLFSLLMMSGEVSMLIQSQPATASTGVRRFELHCFRFIGGDDVRFRFCLCCSICLVKQLNCSGVVDFIGTSVVVLWF